MALMEMCGKALKIMSKLEHILQSWTKVLGIVLQYTYFPVISRFHLKTVHHFRNFLAVLPPPTLYKGETQISTKPFG